MGYKTPNVVKEVYLPYPVKEDGSYTYDVQEYKEYFGIDLEDLFNFRLITSETGNHYKLSPKNPYTKFYLVNNNSNGFAKIGIQPFICIDNPNDANTIRVIESDGLEDILYSYWKIEDGKTFTLGEL